MVFLFLFRQVLRQPIAVFAYNIFLFLRYSQKLQSLSGCYRKAVTILAAQSSSSRQPLLSCKSLYSFHLHYISGFRCAPHLPFHSGYIRYSHLQSTGCQCLGSPAGRCGLRFCHSFCSSNRNPNIFFR